MEKLSAQKTTNTTLLLNSNENTIEHRYQEIPTTNYDITTHRIRTFRRMKLCRISDARNIRQIRKEEFKVSISQF